MLPKSVLPFMMGLLRVLCSYLVVVEVEEVVAGAAVALLQSSEVEAGQGEEGHPLLVVPWAALAAAAVACRVDSELEN